MPQLDVSTYPSQIFWLLVCFSLLCLAMVNFLAPRIAKTLEQREKRIKEDLESAAKLQSEISELHKDNMSDLLESRKKASELLQRTHDDLHALKQQRLQSFDEELSHKLKQLRDHLDVEKNTILANLSNIVTHLIATVSPKIIAQSIEEEAIKRIVDRVIEERRLG